MDHLNVLFISGTGRCGTNLAKEIMGCHSRAVSFPFELRFLTDPGGLADLLRNTQSPFAYSRAVMNLSLLLSDLAFKDAQGPYPGYELQKHLPGYAVATKRMMDKLIKNQFPARWVGSIPGISDILYVPPTREEIVCAIRTFLKTLFTDISPDKFLVLDETWALMYSREIIEMIPGARFLWMERDAFDTIRSMQKVKWAPDPVDQAARFFGSCHAAVTDGYWYVAPRNRKRITYESLVKDPADCIADVYMWLGLEDEGTEAWPYVYRTSVGSGRETFTEEERETIYGIVARMPHFMDNLKKSLRTE